MAVVGIGGRARLESDDDAHGLLQAPQRALIAKHSLSSEAGAYGEQETSWGYMQNPPFASHRSETRNWRGYGKDDASSSSSSSSSAASSTAAGGTSRGGGSGGVGPRGLNLMERYKTDSTGPSDGKRRDSRGAARHQHKTKFVPAGHQAHSTAYNYYPSPSNHQNQHREHIRQMRSRRGIRELWAKFTVWLGISCLRVRRRLGHT